MRAFIDTSTLFKKYVEEEGSKKLDVLLQEVSEIAVSPVTWIEMNAVLARHLREKYLTVSQVIWLRAEAHRDFQSYHRVVWNEILEKTAANLAGQHSLATLDLVQLASCLLSKADLFLTSDRALFEEARKRVRKVIYV